MGAVVLSGTVEYLLVWREHRFLIYGAGSSGRQLQVALLQGNEFYPVAFVDDDPAKQGCVIQGCTVYNSAQLPT